MDEKNFENAGDATHVAEHPEENPCKTLKCECLRGVHEMEHCMCGTEGEHCRCREILPWLGFLAVAFISLWLRAHFITVDSMNWFQTLIHPLVAPPLWLFPLVWVITYFWMSTAMWLAWARGGVKHTMIPFILFLIILTLEILSSYAFFHHHDPFLGFVCQIWVFVALILMVGTVMPFSRCSVKLLMPMLIWTIYLIGLNYEYWRVNL